MTNIIKKTERFGKVKVEFINAGMRFAARNNGKTVTVWERCGIYSGNATLYSFDEFTSRFGFDITQES